MILNCFEPAYNARGQTVDKWGKDQTGLISYRFNNQGFRSDSDYNWTPDWAFFGSSVIFGVGIPVQHILASRFRNSHNYGLSGAYMNHHSVTNLQNFIASPYYSPNTQIVFFWIDRPGEEEIPPLITQVNLMVPNVLHISQGQKYEGAQNLMPHIDSDVSGTHPGPATHKLWARSVALLCQK